MKPEEQWVQEIEARLSRMRALYDSLLQKYRPGDLRLEMVASPANTLRSYQLFFAMVLDTMTELSWWDESFGHMPDANDQGAIKNMDKMTRFSFFFFFLSRIEWSMRKLVTHISPGSCQGGRAEFKSIHDHLLKRLDLARFVPLYDLCRMVRNGVHTNAFVVNRSGVDKSVDWKGETFAFRDLQPIDFMTYERIFDLYSDLIDSIEAILGHPEVAQVKRMDDGFAL